MLRMGKLLAANHPRLATTAKVMGAVAPPAPPRALASQLRCARSVGKRDFFQRIDEKYLARELEDIATAASGSAAAPSADLAPIDARIRAKAPRHSAGGALRRGVSDDGDLGSSVPGSPAAPAHVKDFEEAARRARPWLHYESLRGTTYPSGDAKRPRWQDLTHAEAQRLQEMYMRKRMLDRKVQYLKRAHLPNPHRDAKMALRKEAEKEKEEEEGKSMELYPPPLLNTTADKDELKLQKMMDSSRHEELESRFRNRIREQKLENARIVKASVPVMNGVVTDPIQRHIEKRLLRQRPGIHMGLEDVLTFTSSQILHEFLQGVAISVVRVHAQRPRATQDIYYNLSSDHDPAWVQRQLDILAPKIRSMLALKINMGQTPNIRFVPNQAVQESKRAYLWAFAKQIRAQVPPGGGYGASAGGQRRRPPR